MESQMVRPHGHSCEEDPHKLGLHYEGEEDHHHDKKSVLKKVKAKAKKIKETLKKHGHGHDQGHDHDEEEDGDGDEEMEEEPEVHGAPMYESTARSYVPGQEENLGQTRVHLGRTTALGTDHDAPLDRPDTGNYQTKMTDPNWTFVSGQPRVNFGGSTALEEDPHSPKDRPEAFSPSNYQTKVTDPTGAGGAEAGITPILRSFGRMNVFDEPEPGPEQNLPTGSHDQFSPEPLPTKTTTIPENPQSVPESFNATKHENQPQDNEIGNQSSYTEKISYATSAVADKAISAKNAVASKLGYGGNDNAVAPQMHEGEGTAKSAPVGEYGRKITATLTEKLAPVYEKVAVAGSTVMSKVHGTGSDTGTEKEGGIKGPDKGVSVKEYLADKLRPGDEDRALSEVISDVLHRQKHKKEKEKEKAAKASQPAVGKVRESEEVARRLGTGEENAGEGVDSGNASPRMGVVDRLKGAVSSWFGKGGECQTSQDPLKDNIAFSSPASEEEVGHSNDNYNVGERRLQESSN